MKTQLLTLAAIAWSASAMAGSWEKPTAPAALDENSVAIENGGHYYATPKGTGQFLCGSNSWGTQASLDKKGYEVVLYNNVNVGNRNDIENTWSIAFPSIKMGNKDYAGDFLFNDNGNLNSMFCNAYNGASNSNLQGNRNQIHFVFTQVEGEGSPLYRIQSTIKAAELLEDEEADVLYLGWDGSRMGEKGVPQLDHLPVMSIVERETEDGDIVEEEVVNFVDWAFIPVEVYEGYADLYATYEAKLRLYNKLNEAEEAGVTNLDDVVAIYDSAESTIEDYDAAINTLTDRIMHISTEEVDVTERYIKNPTCDADEGWSGFNSQTSHYEGENGAVIDGRFFEKWTPNNGGEGMLGDFTLAQTITIPAGKYRLQADVIASQQSDNDVEVNGVKLYADCGNEELYVESDDIWTENGRPQTISIEFQSFGTTTIGLKIEGTNANWVAIDNFKLFFQGYITDPAALAAYLQTFADSPETFSAATRDAISAIIGKCKTVGEDQVEGLFDEANVLIAQVEKEIAAYKKLEELIDRSSDDVNKYAAYGSMAEDLSAYNEQLTDHFNDGDWSVEQIDEAIAGYDNMLIEGVRNFIATEAQPGTDISILLKNPDMDEGRKYVNGDTEEQIPGWEGTQVWGYDKSACEFWNMNFDFYQDIEGLPAGKYTVSFQGFYRWGQWGNVADAYLNDPTDKSKITAVLYGNNVETTFKNICDGRVSDPETEGWAATCGEDEEGNTYKIPNSMEQAQWVFTNHPELYYTEATAVVGEDGHLRIGIKGGSDIGDRWVIFDSFRLRYDGNGADVYAETMYNQVDAIMARAEHDLAEHSLPADLYNEIKGLKDKCDALLANEATTGDDCAAFLVEINTLSGKLDKASAAINALIDDYKYYTTASMEEEGEKMCEMGNAEFTAMYINIDEKLVAAKGEITETLWATIDELEAAAHTLNALFVKSIWDEKKDATLDNPGEITAVIRNPEMQLMTQPNEDDGTPEYVFLGNDHSDLETANYTIHCWNGGAVGQYAMGEVWNRNFDVYQTLASLPAGYYDLVVRGFYRYGSSEDAAKNHYEGTEYLAAKLYAQQVTGNDTVVYAKPLMSIIEGSDEALAGEQDVLTREVLNEDGEVVATYYIPNTRLSSRAFFESENDHYKGNKVSFYSNGGDVQIGIRKDSLLNGDWTVFDEFQLFYLGTEAPDAIGSVQGGANGLAVKQAYFTVGGVQVARPQRGVNIVITTLSDGTKVASKVLVK